MKKTDLQKRLKNYSALAGTLAVSAGAVNGQIVYTDVNPDAVLDTAQASYFLNFDGDAVTDFAFYITFSATGTQSAYGLAYMQPNSSFPANQPIGYTANVLQYQIPVVSLLQQNDNIDANQNFQAMTIGTGTYYPFLGGVGNGSSGSFSFGPWRNNIIDGYVGAKFEIAGNTHYGWVRLDANIELDSVRLVIKDYAYNSVVGQGILAGEKPPTNIPESLEGKVSFIQKDNQLVVNVFSDELSKGTLKVLDLTGKVIENETLTNGTNRLTLNGLSQAMYLVAIEFEEGIFTEKIFIR